MQIIHNTGASPRLASSTLIIMAVHQIALGLQSALQAPDLKPSVFAIIRSLNHLKMSIITEFKMQIEILYLYIRKLGHIVFSVL